jgi:hypothetical protein
MSPYDWFLMYFVAAIPSVMIVVFTLTPARNPFMAVVVTIGLVIGWWRPLFWNPIVSIEVERGSVSLQYRRGPATKLSRNDLVSMEEYRFGQAKRFIGLRFRIRDSADRTTAMIPDVVRDNLSRHIANELQLTCFDHADGHQRWTI